MVHPKIDKITEKYKRADLPEIKPGMIIRLVQKIKEGDKVRNQTIEGLVIAQKHGQEMGNHITIRRIIGGIGTEWSISRHSPQIEKIEIIKASKVRRAKLYYMRRKSQKETRLKLRREIKVARQAKKPEPAAPSSTQKTES